MGGRPPSPSLPRGHISDIASQDGRHGTPEWEEEEEEPLEDYEENPLALIPAKPTVHPPALNDLGRAKSSGGKERKVRQGDIDQVRTAQSLLQLVAAGS